MLLSLSFCVCLLAFFLHVILFNTFFVGNCSKFWVKKSICVYVRMQDPPWFEFLVFLTFLHHGIEQAERHLLWKFHKKFQRKRWSNVPPKLLACKRFLYKVVQKKTAVSESSIALGRLNLTFLLLGLSLWNLAHVFIMFMATKFASAFSNLS